MTDRIPYIKWRSYIDEITPADHRIGSDILLIDNAESLAHSSYEPFRVDMTMALIYDKGWADIRINMRDYHVEAPAVIVIIKDQVYQPIAHSEDISSKVILMSSSFSDSLFVNMGETLPLQSAIIRDPVITMTNEENVFGQFYQLLLNVMSSPRQEYKLEVAKHLTLSFFYGYSNMKHDVQEVEHASTRQEEIFNEFIRLLETHHKREREIGFYADKMCMTPKYLSTVIKEVTGRTALDMIEEYVISECKALLMSTTMNVQQISDELNFPSQSVFGKYFKRLTGMSPKEYRKNL